MNLASTQSYRVVCFLLEHPRTNILEISRATGVSYGWSNEVVNFLKSGGIVSMGWRRCELVDAIRLLEILAFQRPFDRLTASSFNLEVLSVTEGEALLMESCRRENLGYGLTVFSGLRRFMEYYITYPTIHAYVEDIRITEQIPKGNGPISVNLMLADHPDILDDSVEVEGFSVCSRAQVMIDLFSSGLGRDAAIKLVEMMR
ncbi:MAG: hypothetical protein ACE5Z5_01945 [Candidatus Bathyarchaeia archaeon]